MTTLRESFEVMVAVLEEVGADMHRLAALEEAGEEHAALQRVCGLAWPAIVVKWDRLRAAQRTGHGTPEELAALIAQLHQDLLVLREVLAGRLDVSALEEN
jgi:hypothetical protein